MYFNDKSTLNNMNKIELEKWFWNKFNSCYFIQEINLVYFYYNEQYIREKKLCNILNKKLEKPISLGNLLFIINWKTGYLEMSIDIWHFLENNYNGPKSSIYQNTKNLILSWLNKTNIKINDKKINTLIPTLNLVI